MRLNFLSHRLKIAKLETFAVPQVGIVKITLDDDSTGWGQIASFEAADIVAEIIHRQISPCIIGIEFASLEAVLQKITDKTMKFHGSHISRGMSAIETALMDVIAKQQGKLVTEMLGGNTTPIPVYGSSMSRSITPANEGKRLKILQQEFGFNAFKVRVGKECGHDEDEWPGRTEEIIPLMRRVLGADTVIHADANSCYSPAKASEVGRMLEHHGYGHFEEPCPYWMLDWTREVSSSLDIAVAGGEQDHAPNTWESMIRDRVVDIVQPDIGYCGGISVALNIARLAQAQGLVCVPHCANHSLITVFTMHLWNALPNAGPFMEYSIEEQHLYAGLYHNAPRLEEGKLHFMSEGYGWGVQIRQQWLDQAVHRASASFG